MDEVGQPSNLKLWYSQNVIWSRDQFMIVPVHSKSLHNGFINDTINDITNELFNNARNHYVAIGQWDIDHIDEYRIAVFAIRKSNRQFVFDLLPNFSRFGPPRSNDYDSFNWFWTAVMRHLVAIFPVIESRRVRIWQRPYIRRDNVQAIARIASAARFTMYTVDKSTRKHNILDEVTVSPRQTFTLWKLSANETHSPDEIKAVTSPELPYYQAKRDLERLIEKRNIREDFQNLMPDILPLDQQRELIDHYKSWLREMASAFAIRMPTSLQTFIARLPNEIADNNLITYQIQVENQTDAWSLFFMELETKYPVLLATVYMWRIDHLLLLLKS